MPSLINNFGWLAFTLTRQLPWSWELCHWLPRPRFHFAFVDSCCCCCCLLLLLFWFFLSPWLRYCLCACFLHCLVSCFAVVGEGWWVRVLWLAVEVLLVLQGCLCCCGCGVNVVWVIEMAHWRTVLLLLLWLCLLFLAAVSVVAWTGTYLINCRCDFLSEVCS